MALSSRIGLLGASGMVALGVAALAWSRVVPPAVYGTDPGISYSDSALPEAPENGITATFVNAPISKVLEWLAKQDASFIVTSRDVPGGMTVTLHFRNEPLHAVERAIAKAMGGTWLDQDGVMIFQREGLGGNLFRATVLNPSVPPGQTGELLAPLPKGTVPQGLWKVKPDSSLAPTGKSKNETLKIYEFDKDLQGQLGKALRGSMSQPNGLSLQGMGPDSKSIDEIVQRAMEEAEKSMAAVEAQQSGDQKKQLEDARRALQEAEKAIQKSGGVRAPRLQGMTDAQNKAMQSALKELQSGEMQRKMLDARKALQADGQMKVFGAPGLDPKDFDSIREEIERATADQSKALQAWKTGQLGEEMKKAIGERKLLLDEATAKSQLGKAKNGMLNLKLGESEMSIKLAGIREVMRSLSDEQKAKMKKQGYLKGSDLTPQQRKQIGDVPDDLRIYSDL